MNSGFNGLDRIDLFAQGVISIISMGKTETIKKIVEEMEKKNVVSYLYNKYKDYFSIQFDGNSPYNVDAWEEKFSDYSYITENDARRKWGIVNENDGLLLLVSLTFEALRSISG